MSMCRQTWLGYTPESVEEEELQVIISKPDLIDSLWVLAHGVCLEHETHYLVHKVHLCSKCWVNLVQRDELSRVIHLMVRRRSSGNWIFRRVFEVFRHSAQTVLNL